MKIYQVGGAVRDELLGLPIKDRDWVVVGVTEAEMLAQGFACVEGNFPVFLHPETGDEYALARKEQKQGIGYKGFVFETGPEITLEEDLLRRDLTINAIAQDEEGRLHDPCQGQADIESRMLRHITPAFAEDPLRVLRVARFAARFGHLGFHLAHDTFQLMKQMSQADELVSLPSERVWMEVKQVLSAPQPWRFFEILHRCGALCHLLPALDAGWPKSTPHKKQQIDPMAALKQAVTSDLNPEGRFVVLVFNLIQLDAISDLKQALPLEKSFQEALSDYSVVHALCAKALQQDAAATYQLIKRSRALQQPHRFWTVLGAYGALNEPLSLSDKNWLKQALAQVRGVSADTIKALGLQGAEIGQAIEAERLKVLQMLAEKASSH